MALFNFPNSGGGLFGGMLEYGGPGGYERLPPELEARLAQEARDAAAGNFRRNNGRAQGTADMSLFNDPTQAPPTLTQQMMPQLPFQGGFMPPPAMQPQASAPAMPAPINVPSLNVMSQPLGAPPAMEPPTDISSRGRMPGAVPAQAAPMPVESPGTEPDAAAIIRRLWRSCYGRPRQLLGCAHLGWRTAGWPHRPHYRPAQ
jgi:hypothetical protein